MYQITIQISQHPGTIDAAGWEVVLSWRTRAWYDQQPGPCAQLKATLDTVAETEICCRTTNQQCVQYELPLDHIGQLAELLRQGGLNVDDLQPFPSVPNPIITINIANTTTKEHAS